THAGLVKQDRATALIDKVANWAEFNREIFARGLERRAFGYPLQGWRSDAAATNNPP
ncbi:MAG TPA: hypothetical protein GYA10_07925, partial [Alphaproteobacteria bacterium]|nr:hypothetical protein [Alphaproteobacteria bacterium]